MKLIISIYRFLFARAMFYRLNKLLYRCSLSGLGILNYENDSVSGEKRFLRQLLPIGKPATVLDVGANIGNYSCQILEINPAATVYAFEPHPKTFSRLCDRIKTENFHPINAAVGSEAGSTFLYDYAQEDGSSHASLYKDVIENIHKAKSVEHTVQVISLQNFVQERGIAGIDLLKVDTEGNELNVLKGLGELARQGRISAIHFEFNEMNVSSRTFFRDFWTLLPNYDFYRLLPDGMARIEAYSPVFCEIFAYQNIVAILKRD